MEDILRAIVRGVIQGLTEFLPISSSGHLIVARDLFGWEFADDLTFDVALHLGTTAAVLIFFRDEWLYMLRGGLARIFGGEPAQSRFGTVYDERLLVLLALASVPTAIVGIVVSTWFEDDLRDPIVVGVMLVVVGLVIYGAERVGKHTRRIESTTWRDAVFIGLAQALSLVPGTSRSGATISAGLVRGFDRGDAARFSFLLATPASLGAGLLTTVDAIADGIPADDLDIILVGAVVSAIVGFVAIGGLLRLVQTRSFLPFVVYRLAAGAFVIAYFAV